LVIIPLLYVLATDGLMLHVVAISATISKFASTNSSAKDFYLVEIDAFVGLRTPAVPPADSADFDVGQDQV
jgi:hypothetical protein